MFASDNGPFWRPQFIERYGHRAAGPFRGMKADIWEGGHRIPLIVRWPGHVEPGSVSSAPTTLANLMATCADIIGDDPPSSAIDSYSILSVLRGKSQEVQGQPAIVHHSSMGHFAVRKGEWKLIDKAGSGGFSLPVGRDSTVNEPEGQLYNLQD